MFSLVSALKTSMTWCESMLGGLAQGADLVGERDLEGVEAVVDVLRHLGHGSGHVERRAGEAGVEPGHHRHVGAVVAPDDRLGRGEEVGDRRALPEELRVHAHGEVPAGDQATRRLELRHDDAVARARQHRRAHDDDVTAVGRQGGADLRRPRARDRSSTAIRWAPTASRRRRSARSVASTASAHRRRRPQPPRLDAVGDEIADPLLEHGRAAVVDRVDLDRVDVDADDVVTALGEAGGRHDPDVAQAEDGDPHRRIVLIAARADPAPRRRCGSQRPRPVAHRFALDRTLGTRRRYVSAARS